MNLWCPQQYVHGILSGQSQIWERALFTFRFGRLVQVTDDRLRGSLQAAAAVLACIDVNRARRGRIREQPLARLRNRCF